MIFLDNDIWTEILIVDDTLANLQVLSKMLKEQGYKVRGAKPAFSRTVNDAFFKYDWPGNVSELQNTIHRYVSLGKVDFLDMDLTGSVSRDNISLFNIEAENETLPVIL
ncbi:hypothetical protein QUF70_21225 [Desulfobacterales bacterium HSG17]|nr:hypothetical protein [Desulfobacterales bacterium HSG17]